MTLGCPNCKVEIDPNQDPNPVPTKCFICNEDLVEI